jgi:hypothetical protein
MGDRVKVALLRRGDISIIDGINRYIFTLAEALSMLGHKVTVIGGSLSNIDKVIEIFGVKGKRIGIIGLGIKGGYLTGSIKWLLKFLPMRSNFDVVISNAALPLFFAPPKILVNRGLRGVTGELTLKEYQLPVYRSILKLYNVLICLNKEGAEELRRLLE